MIQRILSVSIGKNSAQDRSIALLYDDQPVFLVRFPEQHVPIVILFFLVCDSRCFLSCNLPTYLPTCVRASQVSRVQYGSAGHDEMPRGLLLENFLMHSHPGLQFGNGLAKVIDLLVRSQPHS